MYPILIAVGVLLVGAFDIAFSLLTSKESE